MSKRHRALVAVLSLLIVLDACSLLMSHAGPMASIEASSGSGVRSSNAESANWAGLVYCPSGLDRIGCVRGSLGMSGVFGCWDVADVSDRGSITPQQGAQSLATWIGIGGFDGLYDLVQIGTTSSPGVPPMAWWETLPAVESVIGITVNPGDFVCAQITLLGANLFGQQVWYLSIQDVSDGQAWNNGLTPDVCGGAYFWAQCTEVTVDSAEWIAETPQVGGHIANLPDFNTFYICNLEVESSGTWFSVGASTLAGSYVSIDLTGPGGGNDSQASASLVEANEGGAVTMVEVYPGAQSSKVTLQTDTTSLSVELPTTNPPVLSNVEIIIAFECVIPLEGAIIKHQLRYIRRGGRKGHMVTELPPFPPPQWDLAPPDLYPWPQGQAYIGGSFSKSQASRTGERQY